MIKEQYRYDCDEANIGVTMCSNEERDPKTRPHRSQAGR